MSADPAAFVPVAVTTRSGVDESVHFGAGVAVGADGRVVASIGDPGVRIFPRSSLKPLQAMAMVELGLDVPAPQLALVCASHDGAAQHVEGVDQLLRSAGLGRGALGNTPTLPYDAALRDHAVRMAIGPQAITQNCSGKHAGMVATCVVNGWSVDDYLERQHPLQQAIVASIEADGSTVYHVGVDGCGAPTHVLALDDLARAVGRIAAGTTPAGHRVAAAMSGWPDLVGGPTRADSSWMRAVPGLVAKDGAEGVMVLGLPDGSAAALKVADGAERARRAMTVEALRALGVDVDGHHASVVAALAMPVLGHGEPVGDVRALPWVR